MRALVLAALLAITAPCMAQDDAWRVVATRRVDAFESIDLAGAEGPSERPVRIRVRGTLSSSIDGSTLDARGIERGAGVRDETRAPLVLPEGTVLVSADPAVHEYVLDVPRGSRARIAIDVGSLAARHLVTASEERAALTGALIVEVMAPVEAVPPVQAATAAVVETSSAIPGWAWAGGLVSAPLLFGLLIAAARRRARPEEVLLRRAVAAHGALVRAARALGTAFAGATRAADGLLAGARHASAHVAALDRAIRESEFVRSGEGAAKVAELRARRLSAIERLSRVVAQMEEAAVELAGARADRSEAGDVEQKLSALRSELEIGSATEAELARI